MGNTFPMAGDHLGSPDPISSSALIAACRVSPYAHAPRRRPGVAWQFQSPGVIARTLPWCCASVMRPGSL